MTQFEQDLQKPLSINGRPSSKAFYNLVVSIRDAKLWVIGMKPHRHWKISDVKAYFGVKGNKEQIVKELEALREKHFPKK